MMQYNFTTATIGILVVFSLLYLIRKNSIYVRYTFWWLAICGGILLFSIFPQLSDVIVRFLGISYPPALIFFIAILMLFVKILSMDIERSRQEIRIRRLVQRLAILEAEMGTKTATTSEED